MKSLITSILMKADTAGRFLNDKDCQEIEDRLSQTEKRLEIATQLSSIIDAIAQQSKDMLLKNHPEFQKPGQCGDSPQKVQHWYQDIKDYLRIITYCLIIRSPEPIYQYNGHQATEFFNALNVPLFSCIEGLTQARDLLLASGKVPEEMTEEVNDYFEKLIATFA